MAYYLIHFVAVLGALAMLVLFYLPQSAAEKVYSRVPNFAWALFWGFFIFVDLYEGAHAWRSYFIHCFHGLLHRSNYY